MISGMFPSSERPPNPRRTPQIESSIGYALP